MISTFISQPYNTALLLGTLLAVLLCWRQRASWAVGVAALLVGAAYYLHRINLQAVIVLGCLSVSIAWFYKFSRPAIRHLFFVTVIFAVCFMAYVHAIPGFYSWAFVKNMHFSAGSTAYSMYLSLDKIIPAIALVALGRMVRAGKDHWKDALAESAPTALFLIVCLISAGLYTHYVNVDIKVPATLPFWAIYMFFFVCFAEEALFRGFLQKELTKVLGPSGIGPWIALLVSAVMFGLLHYRGGTTYVILSTVAGIGYGYVYKKSERLEAAMLCHFTVNLIHLLFFSYPALAR